MQRIGCIGDRETESQLGGREVPRGWQEATVTSLDCREKDRRRRCHWSPGARFWQNWTTKREELDPWSGAGGPAREATKAERAEDR